MVFLHRKSTFKNIEKNVSFLHMSWCGFSPTEARKQQVWWKKMPPAAALNVLVAVLAPTEATSRTNHKAVGKPIGRGPKIVQTSRKKYICFVMEQDVWSVGQLAFSRKALLFWKRSQLGLGGQRGAPLERSAANVSIVSESWSPNQVTESCLYGSRWNSRLKQSFAIFRPKN